MPLPSGFFALSPLEGALGPFADSRKPTDSNFPVFARFRIRWWPEGLVETPRLPNAPLSYPAAVLYGGPAPREWAEKTLPAWVSQWTRSLAPPENAPAGRWYLETNHVVLLVPPEALFYPYQDFRWSWFYDQAEPDVYQIEGQKALPQFRNLRTGQWDRPGPFGNMFNEVPPVAISGDQDPPVRVAIVPELNEAWRALDSAASQLKAQLISKAEEDEVDPPVRTWLTEDAWADGIEWPPWIVDNNELGRDSPQCSSLAETESGACRCALPMGHSGDHVCWPLRWQGIVVGQGFYQRYRLGEQNGRIQCAATTKLDGVPIECSLIAGHPGPHVNGPPELGRVWLSCHAELLDPSTGWRWQCSQPGGHDGMHMAAGHAWPQHSDELGAVAKKPVSAPKGWYRLHYLDVVTGNEAWVPHRQLTSSSATSWRKQRETFGSPVMVFLEKFVSGEGWVEL